MKKKIALMLVLLMAFATHPTVFAHPLIETPSSFNFEMEMRFSLDVQAEELDAYLGFALALLRDVKVNAQGTVIANPDNFEAFHSHMEVEIYAGFFYIPLSFWIDLDISDPEELVYIVVVEVPDMLLALAAIEEPELAKPYWLIDFGAVFADSDELLEGFASSNVFFNFGDEGLYIEQEELLNLLPELEALGGNRYRWALSDAWLVDFIQTHLADYYLATIGNFHDPESSWTRLMAAMYFNIDYDDLTDEYVARYIAYQEAELLESLQSVLEILNHVTIFSEDWASYYLLDDYGLPVQIDSSFQLLFDLAQWVAAIALVDEDVLASSEDIPDVVVTFDMEYSISYSNVNSAGRVPFPVLTEENSVNILELLLGDHHGPVTFPMLAMN